MAPKAHHAKHQDKPLIELEFSSLGKKVVQRHSVPEMRALLLSKGLSIEGKKDDLIGRVMDAVAAHNLAHPLDVGEAAAPVVVPAELSVEQVTARIEDLSTETRDLLVGKQMRLLGGDWSAKYSELLHAAIRASPMEVKGRLINPNDKDRYVPFRCRQWFWNHVHLRHSDGGQRWFCNHCAWEIPTAEVPAGVSRCGVVRPRT